MHRFDTIISICTDIEKLLGWFGYRGEPLALPKVQCPNHPDAILVEDYRAGDMICPECGLVVGDRVIDVGSEWRTFSNEKALKDPSRVGDAQNPLLNGGDLTTMISKGTGAASFDEFGNSKYQNRRTMSSSDRAMLNAFQEISTMADRINLPRNIVVSSNPEPSRGAALRTLICWSSELMLGSVGPVRRVLDPSSAQSQTP
ncbi:transcription initiation factor IIB [Nematolebias whitei]|uniref:transcription initiation factor IIB n=1 Tax=Nematolebias whitei TaxID=451745 RepID=UPI001897F2BC|nr:transcription initiation factor IIB [Nematolebias whitei]